MHNLIHSGLHRALTWRYILVTVAALLIIEVLVILLIVRFTPPYTIGMQPDVYLMEQLKAQAAEYLERGERDALQEWLLAIDRPVINLTVRDDWLRANLSRFPQPETQMLLIFHETEGVIASNPPHHPFSAIQRVEELPGPFDSTLFQSVPERPGPDGVMTRNGNQTIAAYPIQQADGTLLALLILINLATDVPPSITEVLTLAVTSLLVITVAVGLLGGFFGYLSSQFLVRQARGLAATTARWGEGDFSQPVVQNAIVENELDELALHLDQLRPQMQESLLLHEAVAVQGERQRIAQELHDSVKQQLFTLRMNLATAQTLQQDANSAVHTYLQNAVSLAENAQQEITSIIEVFYQRPESTTDPATRLQALLTTWSQQTQIAVESEIAHNLMLTVEVEHTLRRILQELLANVYQHSRADQVQIHLTQSETGIQLSVRDNGCGFDVDARRNGLGLTSIRERVRASSGTITIESGLAGTAIVVQIPQSAARRD